MEKLEQEFYNILASNFHKDSSYDYLILFSGGKDSTYLAHKVKQAKGGRICLFSVDNGFESDFYLNNLREKADLLKMDLYIHRPLHTELKTFYKFLIVEQSLLEFDSNPLCFFCSRNFMRLGIEFAQRNNIPFVIYGATPAQLKMREIKNIKDVKLFDFMFLKRLKSIYKKIQQLETYKKNPVIKKYFDKIFHIPDKVELIFPFEYLEYNVEKIKTTLEKEYNWQNPVGGLSNKFYLSSGCELIRLFGLFKKNFNMKFHEIDQFQSDFKKGIINKETYEYNIKYFSNLMEYKSTLKTQEIIKDLELEIYL